MARLKWKRACSCWFSPAKAIPRSLLAMGSALSRCSTRRSVASAGWVCPALSWAMAVWMAAAERDMRGERMRGWEDERVRG